MCWLKKHWEYSENTLETFSNSVGDHLTISFAILKPDSSSKKLVF